MRVQDIWKDLDLTPKQQLLVHYLCQPNNYPLDDPKRDKKFRDDCFVKAGYLWTDSTSKKSIISRGMRSEKITKARSKYIQYLMAERKDELHTVILRTLELRCSYDVSDFYKKDGTPKPLNEIDPELRKACLSNVQQKATGGKRFIGYDLPDKAKATKELNDFLNSYNKQQEELELKLKSSGEGSGGLKGIQISIIK